MDPSLASVIIPAYNNAAYLGDAIQSVLGQTHKNIELIVVNDASPDNVENVVAGFDDQRLKYIKHERNRGLSAARNTGIRASVGEYIALLDGDDYFHPDKLKAHLDFFEKNSDISVTYNARFELNHSSETIREIWRPPLKVDISDLVLGYPFSPSDMVVRRNSMFEAGLFDESLTYFGEDLDINCKLALIGCKFASIDHVLNYRRYHSRRVIQNLSSYKEDELRALTKALTDGRFPESLRNLHDMAIAKRLLGWSILAFVQGNTLLGAQYGLEAVQLYPRLLVGEPNEFLLNILGYCTLDEDQDHEKLIRLIVRQLPPELLSVASQSEWAISRGYLLRGCRAVMWERSAEGKSHLGSFSRLHGSVDATFIRQLCSQVYSYEREFGPESADRVIHNLSLSMDEIRQSEAARLFKGEYFINKAFRKFGGGEYSKVPGVVLQSLIQNPSHLLNRGVLKILFNSVVHFLK